MNNQDIDVTRDYHESTKLAYINLTNKPPLYKAYPGLADITLPTDFAPPQTPTLEAVAGNPGEHSDELDLTALARLLYFSAGVLHKRILPVAGEVHYRAAASAGALYPVEVYAVTGGIPGLEAGVYHFTPDRFALTQLRSGDYRRELAAAAARDDSQIAESPMTLVFTAMFWRSAWKYRIRSYRYCFWDAGTILANTLAVARGGAGLPARLVTGFVDDEVNTLLGLDQEREAALCLVPVGIAGAARGETLLTTQASRQPLATIKGQPTEGYEGEIEYPEIIQAHAASCLASREEVVGWRESAAEADSTGPRETRETRAVSLRNAAQPESQALGDSIAGRGSTRHFSRSNISLEQFSAILDNSTKQLPADFLAGETVSLVDPYIIVNAVEGLEPGAYYFSPLTRELELLKRGDFREEAGHLCFEQALGADSSAVVYFLADLDRILARYGNRGYRTAQLEAGVMAGNAYLCSHSLGLGATGMTFYDDDVTEFFSPHAVGKSMMFLVALGNTDKVNRVRPFRSKVGVLLDSLARGAGKPAS
ncbi:MAG: hypothetical protein BZY75_00810 [SAR202 cluster bacterium Io17-Chloro-G7]|nr:MAG: hypothetical protein BZY75_00810 [SAR202 cluster bacterium Io17-Chloro-G7]